MPNPNLPMLDGEIYGPVKTAPKPKTYAPTYDPYGIYGQTYGGTKAVNPVQLPQTPNTVNQAEQAQQQAAAALAQQQAIMQAEMAQQQAMQAQVRQEAEAAKAAYEAQMQAAQEAWLEQQQQARADMLGETLKDNVSWNVEDITSPQVGLEQYWNPTPIDSNYFRTQPGGYGFWENKGQRYDPNDPFGYGQYAPFIYGYDERTNLPYADQIAYGRKARGSSMAEALQDAINVMNYDPSQFSYAIEDQPQYPGGGGGGEGEGEEETGYPSYTYPKYGGVDYPETWYEKMLQWNIS